MITDLANRIIDLSSCYTTDKEFLKTCGITNHSLITELKKGRLKSPGANILSDIVRGTGCNARWLLTGEGEMFPTGIQDDGSVAEDIGPREMRYIEQAAHLLEHIDQAPEEIKKQIAGGELPIKFSEISVQLVKLQRDKYNGQDG